MSGLSRDVLKWMQSLDLTWQVKTPKWDLTNGYIIAEIFSWYFPQEVAMHMYNNGTSLESKQKNWFLLKNFIDRHKLDVTEQLVEGTIHCKEGAAELLIEKIYEILTNREAIQSPFRPEIDFTDLAYQQQLPIHARSTASQAVKNNIRNTELEADKNIILCQQKAHTIITNHMDQRKQERLQDPERFSVKPTLGDRALRRAPSVERAQTHISETENIEETAESKDRAATRTLSRSQIPYKEITVKQHGKTDSQRVAA